MKREVRAAQIAQMIEAQAKSGLSKKAFCNEQGISVANFYYWQRRLSEEEQDSEGFTALSVRPAADLELCLPDGQWICSLPKVVTAI